MSDKTLNVVDSKDLQNKIKELDKNPIDKDYKILNDKFFDKNLPDGEAEKILNLLDNTPTQIEIDKLEEELKSDPRYIEIQKLKSSIKISSQQFNDLNKGVINEQLDLFKNNN